MDNVSRQNINLMCNSIALHYPDSALYVLSDWQDPIFLAWCAKQQLPEELRYSASKRQQEFLAGRYCAVRALQQLGLNDLSEGLSLMARHPNGLPAWPTDYTGSISHHHGIAVAWVAPCTTYAQLGLDLEGIISLERAKKLQTRVLHQTEMQLGQSLGYSAACWFTLLFSCKESLYKLLSRYAGRVMPFQAAEITHIEAVNIEGNHLIFDSQPSSSRLDLTCRLTESWSAEWPCDTQLSISAIILADTVQPKWVLSYAALASGYFVQPPSTNHRLRY